MTEQDIEYWRTQLLKIEWSNPIVDHSQINKLCDLAKVGWQARGAQTAEPTLAFTSAELDLIESEMRANVSNINYDRDNQTLKAQYEAVRVKAKAMKAQEKV